MTATRLPRFRTLSPEECEALLGRNHVGRIAYAAGNAVEIVPIHYLLHEGWLYGRTTPGTRLETVGRPWWPVAFQTDEIHGLFTWRSVVVKGGFYPVDEEGAAWEREAWHVGVERLRDLIPETFTAADPTPQRTVLFRISVQEVSGRAAEDASSTHSTGPGTDPHTDHAPAATPEGE
jgi:uncharacterized protein